MTACLRLLSIVLLLLVFTGAAAATDIQKPVITHGNVPVFTIPTTQPPVAVVTAKVTTKPTTTTPGRLSVSSTPSGATLLIDGTAAGTTPYSPSMIAAGSHSLVIRMAGYADATDTVVIPPATYISRSYTLTPLVTQPVPGITGTTIQGPVILHPGSAVPVATTTTAALSTVTQVQAVLPGHTPSAPVNLTIPSLHLFVGTKKQTVGQLSHTIFYPSTRPSIAGLELASKTLLEVSKEYKVDVSNCSQTGKTKAGSGEDVHMLNDAEGTSTASCDPVMQDIWGDRADPYNISADLKNYRFRWATDTANASQGRWQVSIYPFPNSGKNWDNPPGLVAYGTVSGKPAPGGTVFTIPFASFMNLAYGAAPVNADTMHMNFPEAASGGIFELNTYQAAAGKEITGVKVLNAGVGIVFSSVQLGPVTVGIPSGLTEMPSAGNAKYLNGDRFGDTLIRRVFVPGALSTRMAEHERVYYVRIVALDADGNRVDMPSPDVEMHIKGAQLYMLPRDVKTTIGVSTAQCIHTEFPATCTASDVHGLNNGFSETDHPYSLIAKNWINGGVVQDSSVDGLVFNWTTTEPGVKAGKWQLLQTDYPMDAFDWDHPHGFIAEGIVSNDKYFQINLSKYHLPPSSVLPGSDYYPQGGYYVRMLPLGADNTIIGPPSAPVAFYIRQTQPLQAFTCDPATVIHDRHPPSVTIVNYTPIQSEQPDASTHFIWTKACTADELGHCLNPFSASYTCTNPTCMFGAHKIGDTVWFLKESSWFDDFISYIGDFISFISDIVNWVSDTWNAIKAAAVNIVAATIPFCSGSDLCKGALGGALDYTLTAMGVPPTLPTFSDLENMGTDYMIELGTSEIGADGVISPDDVRGAANTLVKAHEAQVSAGPQTGPWPGLVPDPAFMHKPAYIDVIVSNPNDEQTDPSMLRFYDHLDKNIYPDPLNSNSQYAASHIPQSPDDHLFRPRDMPIPSLAPHQTYHIPIILEEDFGYWANNSAYGPFGATWPDQAFFTNYDSSSFTVHVETPSMKDPETASFIYFGSPPPASACAREIHTPPEGWVQYTIQPFTVSPPRNCFPLGSCAIPYEDYW